MIYGRIHLVHGVPVYRHRQKVPAAVWRIEHGMGLEPTVYLPGHAASVIVKIVHLSPDVTEVHLKRPKRGVASCIA